MINLRPVLESDSDILFKWINHRDLVLFNSSYSPVNRVEHNRWFNSIQSKRSDLVFFIIEDLESKKAIGSCQLFNLNSKHQNAELQIRIGEITYHGRGYGTEAVKKLLQHGFNDLNLHRIYLHVFSTNIRAIKSYQKCGFKHEGMLRESAYIDGKWVDLCVMGILRKEYYDSNLQHPST